jgi:Domain of unknown function (DUF4258)
MFERGVTVDDVRDVGENGEIIKEYPDDTPFPSRLILGWRGTRPIHIVAADDTTAKETIIITVYQPEPALWESDFKRKKKL